MLLFSVQIYGFFRSITKKIKKTKVARYRFFLKESMKIYCLFKNKCYLCFVKFQINNR